MVECPLEAINESYKYATRYERDLFGLVYAEMKSNITRLFECEEKEPSVYKTAALIAAAHSFMSDPECMDLSDVSAAIFCEVMWEHNAFPDDLV